MTPSHPAGFALLTWFDRVWLCIAAAAIGATVGVALAQTTAPGQLDAACASDCLARGYDSEFCGRVCVTPEAGEIPADVAVDWICMSDCRERGGKIRDCVPRCERHRAPQALE